MDTITYVVSITPEKRLRFYRLEENGVLTLVPVASLPPQGLAIDLLRGMPKRSPMNVAVVVSRYGTCNLQ